MLRTTVGALCVAAIIMLSSPAAAAIADAPPHESETIAATAFETATVVGITGAGAVTFGVILLVARGLSRRHGIADD